MKKFSFHIPKNNCRFEPLYELKQFNSIFLNLNKPRRSGASPATSDYSARTAATWALFVTFNLMLYENKKTTTDHPCCGETLRVEKIGLENGLRIVKTSSDSPGMELFSIVARFPSPSIETVATIFEIVAQHPDPELFEKEFQALAKQLQENRQQV